MDPSTKPRQVAAAASLAVRKHLGPRNPSQWEVIVFSSMRQGGLLLKELENMGLRAMALCDGRKCLWNDQGVAFDDTDKELDIPASDAYHFDADVIVLDEMSDFIASEDAEELNARILVEANKNITNEAKKILLKKGVKIVQAL